MKLLLKQLHGDKVIWFVVFLLSVFSLLAVYSSTGTLAYKYQQGNTEYYLLKHFSILVTGLGLMYFAHLVDYRYYSRISQLLLYLSIPLLILTYFIGTEINSADRWITLPIINLTFQTSDLAKLALIMFLARVISKKQDIIHDFKNAFIPVILPVVVICLLIAPANLSTALMLFTTSVLIMFIGRIKVAHIAAMGGIMLVSLALMIFILVKTTENNRVATWVNRIEAQYFTDADDAEPYQVVQSKIAIAKGGIFGNGPGNSHQRNFLPHPYSDMIYSIIIEEYGLIGGAFVVFLYLLFLFRAIKIVVKTPNAFGGLLAVGLSISLVLQAMINMAVAVNLVPVTGQTLPLVSMGGTSLFFTSISVGIILSVSREAEMPKENKDAPAEKPEAKEPPKEKQDSFEIAN
ncbi:MAG: FtsW/RodA/SpoVE family cell cycle protein [Chitinophagales bacterium]|nr:FtsW/RodA/SpoVE family cell cycle protein [Chitinophagales bacterium]